MIKKNRLIKLKTFLKNNFKEKNSLPTENKQRIQHLENFLNQKTIDEVSIPRAKIDFVKENTRLKNILKTIVQTGRSRFPVIKKNFEVTGFLYVKDIFNCISELASKQVKDIMRPVMKISYTARIQDVLHDMKKKKKHMAIIVDEYGDIDGLVTLEDILEEFIGEIEDEFDKDEPEYTLQSDGAIINSNMLLKEFNQTFGFQFEEEGVETIGGYICFLAEKIPAKDESFVLENRTVIILEANKKQLMKIKLLNASNENIEPKQK